MSETPHQDPDAAPVCPYCDRPAKLVTGAEVYRNAPHLAGHHFWTCDPCDARVGCHAPGKGYGDGTRPLGRLANARLRKAKSAAHAAFDPLWKGRHKGRRKLAYRWLAEQLGVPVEECHIGMFDEQMCRRVVVVCRAYRQLVGEGA